jgi:hypothetical protein
VIAGEPVDLAGHGYGSLLDAAMTLVHIGGGLELGGRRVRKEGLDLGAQGRLVGLHGEEIIGLSAPDRRCNSGVCRDGVDRDQPFLEAILGGKPLDQDRNGGGFTGLVGAAYWPSTRRLVVAKAETR